MISFCEAEVDRLQAAARERSVETCAWGLVIPAGRGSDDEERFVVRNLIEVEAADYAARTPTAATLKPEFCMAAAKAAKAAGAGVLLVHTHVGHHPLEGFSGVDDAGEKALAPYFEHRLPEAVHFAAVITSRGMRVRRLASGSEAKFSLLGSELRTPGTEIGVAAETYDRQVRAFGDAGQAAISRLRVGIVGVGGTGSVVVQQLAHLGVQRFALIDPDNVEQTNLNRLVGAEPPDVGRPKVAIAARQVARIRPSASCVEIRADVDSAAARDQLNRCDFVFCCTDSMASRAILNQFAYQYHVPVIDMGVGIHVNEGRVEYISGRVQMLSPGLPCLVCTDKIDAAQVRLELMTEDERERDPYISNARVPQPAVISINSTMSSVAVSMFLAAAAGVPSKARMVSFDGIEGTTRRVAMKPRDHCIACSYDGALGWGVRWSLPGRGQ